MKLDGSVLRKLIPVAFVAAVLAFSALVQVSTLASSNDVGYGYRNNCGVKGDGMHDHGKLCPNRPFPGKGLGVLRILGDIGASPLGALTAEGKHGHHHGSSSSTTPVTTTTNPGVADDVQGGSTSHGRGRHGHSRPTKPF